MEIITPIHTKNPEKETPEGEIPETEIPGIEIQDMTTGIEHPESGNRTQENIETELQDTTILDQKTSTENMKEHHTNLETTGLT